MGPKSLNNNNKILITGGNGYIGRATLNLIPNAVTLDIHSNNSIDLTEYTTLYNFIVNNNIEAVLHLGAFKSISESKDQPTNYYFNNLVSSLNLLKICEDLELPMVFASSAAVYYGENPYSKSKYIFEQILKESKVNHIILRYFNVGGLIEPPSKYQLGNVFDVIRSCVKENTTFNINRKTFPRDYSHVLDIANVNLKAISMVLTEQVNKTYDVCSGSDTSLETILDLYAELGVRVLTKVSDTIIEIPKKVNKARFPHENSLDMRAIVASEIEHGLTYRSI